MKRNKVLVPEHLQTLLQQLGLQEEFVFWQHATDFLREKFFTHIVIYPQETVTPPYYVFDFTIISPYGKDWETEKQYADYYEALAVAIQECINSINESHGTTHRPLPEGTETGEGRSGSPA